VPNNIEWLNQNAGRAFPFREDTNLKDSTGTITLPNRLVVDFVLASPSEVDLVVKLSSLQFSGSLLSMIFTDADGNIVTSLAVDLGSHTENQGYRLVGQNIYDDTTGRIAIGDLTDLEYDIPPGQYEFDCEFEPTTVRPDIRAVRALRVVSADGSISDAIYGTVYLRAGTNMQITHIPDPIEPVIRFDALISDLEEECECDSELLSPSPITSINGVSPDGAGNITISAPGECTNISGGQGQIVIEDDCAEPCCGCEELETLMSTIELMSVNLERLQQFVDELETRQEEFSEKVLRSIV